MTRTFPSLFMAGRILLFTLLTMLLGSSVASARDRTPPTAPTNVVVTSTTPDSVTLAWGRSTDNSGRFSYILCCAGSTVTVGQTVTSHTLEGLNSGATYTLRVYAKDAAGNLSKSSNVVRVTLPGDLAAPTKTVGGSAGCRPDARRPQLVVDRRRSDPLVFDPDRRAARHHAQFENRHFPLRRRPGAHGLCAAGSGHDLHLHRRRPGRRREPVARQRPRVRDDRPRPRRRHTADPARQPHGGQATAGTSS